MPHSTSAIEQTRHHLERGCEMLKTYWDDQSILSSALAHFTEQSVLGSQDSDFLQMSESSSVEACSLAADLISRRSGRQEQSAWFGREQSAPIERSRRVLEHLWYEVLLLYAEEQLRWLQYISRDFISKSAALLTEFPNAWELDIACFLIERDVLVSRDVFLSRHGRVVSLERLKGVQTQREVQTIRAAIARLKPGESLSIGRSSTSGRGPTCLTLREEVGALEERELGTARLAFRPKAFRGLSRHHCLVVFLGCGEYLVCSGTDDGMPKNGIYVTDEAETWVRLEAPRVVSNGARVRLGKVFEICLPGNGGEEGPREYEKWS